MKFLIIGLGNIGPQYALIRHNAGFIVLDQLAQSYKATFQEQFLAKTACYTYQGYHLYLVKPTAYMNHNGKAVHYWLQQCQVPIDHSLVVVDDFSLPFGSLRLRPQGTNAGHNGLKSVEKWIGTQAYPRLRVGIGHDFCTCQQAEYVLAPFTTRERAVLPTIVDRACQIIHAFCTLGINKAMNLYNGSLPKDLY